MSASSSIQAALDNTAALLEEITRSPKPSYSVHGHTFSWSEYQAQLVKSMGEYAKMLAQLNPFEEIGHTA